MDLSSSGSFCSLAEAGGGSAAAIAILAAEALRTDRWLNTSAAGIAREVKVRMARCRARKLIHKPLA